MSRVQSFLGCLGFRVFGVRVGFRLGGVKERCSDVKHVASRQNARRANGLDLSLRHSITKLFNGLSALSNYSSCR